MDITWKSIFLYHIIALSVNEKLVEIPNKYKDIAIGAKTKRGRKKKEVVGGLSHKTSRLKPQNWKI